MASSNIVAVITGGATGLGRQQAHHFHKLGAIVIIVGIDLEPLQAIQKELGKERCHILCQDVGKLEAWEAVSEKVEQLGGELHFLANTAGATGRIGKGWDEIDPKELITFNTAFITGVELSYHYLVKYLAKGAENRGKPSVVVNMSSTASVTPRPYGSMLPCYTVAKGAIDVITRCAYSLYKDKNIHSVALNPVFFGTEMANVAAAGFNMTVDQAVAAFNPFPVMGDPTHLGYISTTLFENPLLLESGCCYNVLPLPKELSEGNRGMQSALVNLSYQRSIVDSLDQFSFLRAWATMEEAYDQYGEKMSEGQVERIREALQAKIKEAEEAAASN